MTHEERPTIMNFIDRPLEEEITNEEWETLQSFKESAGSMRKYFSERFLMACLFSRKMDVKRSCKLLKTHLKFRLGHGYEKLPRWEDVNTELIAEEFSNYIYGTRAKDGTAIIYAKVSNLTTENYEHKVIVKDILDFCLYMLSDGFYFETMDFFREGLSVVLDFEGAGWKNLDMGLAKKLNNALLDKFPMRISNIFVVKPPGIFAAVVATCRIFVKKKIMDRIKIIEPEQLTEYIDPDQLCSDYGGTLDYTIHDFIAHIRECISIRRNELKRIRRKGEKPKPKPTLAPEKHHKNHSASELTVTEDLNYFNASSDKSSPNSQNSASSE